jgi:hypothetical protein
MLGFQNQATFSYEMVVVTITEILVAITIGLTWYALRQNIKRLISGEEHETGWLDMLHEMRLRKLSKKQNARNK